MLKTRIITALLLVAGFIPLLFMASSTTWSVVTLIISLLAVYEWGGLVNLSKLTNIIYTFISALFGMAFLFFMEKNGFHWMIYQCLFVFVVTLAFWVLITPVLLTKIVVINNKFLLSLIGIFILAPLWLALISLKAINPSLLLALLTTIWVADSLAYFSGKHYGKHKLAPSISPGKTWEGVLGALLGVTVFAAILLLSHLVESWAIFPLFWIVALLGVIGDLFESLIKRQVNKKDSGSLLPGHGGILDRIDGLLPSLPIAVLLIYLFNYFQIGA